MLGLDGRKGNQALSPNEHEILQHLADGLRISYIGDQMGISKGAVKALLSRVKRRWHCATFTEAVAKALRNGLIE